MPVKTVSPSTVMIAVRLLLCCGLVLISGWSPTVLAEEPAQVRVAAPYIDVRTGPGRGYPVFHVVEQDGLITLLKRRTQWIKVRTPRGREGWVSRAQLSRTLDQTGEYVAMQDMSRQQFVRPFGEAGVMLGELDGVTSITGRLGLGFTENLQVDLEVTESSSNEASTQLLSLGLQHHMFPQWRVSPYVFMGAGTVKIKPATVLVRPETDSERSVYAGLGLRYGLTRTFAFRSEYRSMVVLTDENDNDELEEWRAGFSILF